MLARPGHRDTEEPAFLVEPIGFAARHIRGNAVVDEIKNKGCVQGLLSTGIHCPYRSMAWASHRHSPICSGVVRL